MELQRLCGAGEAHLSYIGTDRFHFSLLSLCFSLGNLTLPEKKALFLLASIMERSNAKNPTLSEYDTALEMLYSPVISFGFSEEGDGEVYFTAGADFVSGGVVGDGLFPMVLSFLSDSMEHTVLESERFSEVFAQTAGFIRGNMYADAGDPETYSALRYADMALYASKMPKAQLRFEDRMSIPDTVSEEDVRAVYEKVRRAPLVYSFFIGREDPDTVREGIRSIVKSTRRISFERFLPRFSEAAVTVDGPMGNMTRINLGFAYDGARETALLLSSYLGGSPKSKLFTVLREEKRCCYSVDAFLSQPGILTVSAAVDPRLAEDAKECIFGIIEEAKKKIDPRIFSAAMRVCLISAREVFDSRSHMEACAHSEFFGYRDSAFGLSDALPVITEDDILKTARSLALKIDYTCNGNLSPLRARGYTKGEWIDG